MDREAFGYSQLVREHFTAPRNVGRLAGGTAGVRVHAAGNPEHGMWVEFSLRVTGAVVTETRFRAYGCPHGIAAASCVAEWAKGRPLEELGNLDAHELAARLELPAEKLGVILVVQDALLGCLEGAPRAQASG